ncbi:trehalose-6-phosphate synthase, partial [Mycobacterium tuberculosis]
GKRDDTSRGQRATPSRERGESDQTRRNDSERQGGHRNGEDGEGGQPGGQDRQRPAPRDERSAGGGASDGRRGTPRRDGRNLV